MPRDSSIKVGIIGLGVMGEALLVAISRSGVSLLDIGISDEREHRIIELNQKYGCKIMSASDVASQANNILLVVKPQDLHSLLGKIGKSISKNQRVVSFVAGKSTSLIEKYLNDRVPVIRVMPNTPMSVGVGASAISAGKYAGDDDLNVVEDLLKASGKTIYVEEKLQDAVTATSGSGPAYFFRFVEAMIMAAQELGLAESDARTLVIQTIAGASEMLKQEGASPKVLRENVTSPNGTTFAALQVFESNDLETIIKKAMRAARDRSQELS
jgi:pyrroline-5-carboxylate reductase